MGVKNQVQLSMGKTSGHRQRIVLSSRLKWWGLWQRMVSGLLMSACMLGAMHKGSSILCNTTN